MTPLACALSIVDFLDPRGQDARGTHFELFWPLWARRAQMSPVAGPERPNILCRVECRCYPFTPPRRNDYINDSLRVSLCNG